MNIQSIEARLKKIDRQRERLSKQLEAKRKAQFSALPAKVGLRSIDQLIEALARYTTRRGTSRPQNGAAASPRPASVTGPTQRTRRRRHRYTAKQKAAVKAAIAKGDKTVGQIAGEYDVSPFSIKDWKVKWGMTNKRRTAAKKK